MTGLSSPWKASPESQSSSLAASREVIKGNAVSRGSIGAAARAPSHFEDITLKDSESDAEDYAYGLASGNPKSKASASTAISAARSAKHDRGSRLPPLATASVGIGIERGLTRAMTMPDASSHGPAGSRRPAYPSLKEQFKSRIVFDGRQSAAPGAAHLGVADGRRHGGGGEKRLASPSTPALPSSSSPSLSSPPSSSDAAGGHLVSRSLSASPIRSGRQQRTALSEASARRTSTGASRRTPPPPPGMGDAARRRSSWQPNRKTVQELEAEYHESDDDVPDDAVIWNVPISPQPVDKREPDLPLTPTSLPPAGSPECKAQVHPQPSSRCDSPPVLPQGLAASESPAPEHPKDADLKMRTTTTTTSSSSPPPAAPQPVRAATVPSEIPQHPQQRHQVSRNITWEQALAELSEDAKHLTEVLKAHADTSRESHEPEAQTTSSRSSRQSSRKSSNGPQRTSSATVVELPPLQSGSVVADSLPISKEKEAVLTRTRPGWLPPKSKDEERRHLKEYQRMMARSLEADRKKAEREEQWRRARDETKMSLTRVWDQYVVPNWDTVIGEPRTRELWWRGITPRSRGAVWQRAVRNELQLTEHSYRAALARAKQAEAELQRQLDMGIVSAAAAGGEHEWFEAIKRDAKTTFPDLCIFQPNGPLHEALIGVLMAYAVYRFDVGYVHGTHLIAGLLLLNLPPPAAFIVLSNLLNQPVPAAFHTGADPATVAGTYQRTLAVLALKQPQLHAHLTQRLCLAPAAFLEPLFRYLFLQTLPLDHASRVWDVFVFEGSTVLVRAAVAVLARLEPALLVYTADEVVRRLGSAAGARGARGAGPSYYDAAAKGTHAAAAAAVPDSPADSTAAAPLSFIDRRPQHHRDATALMPFANHHVTTTTTAATTTTCSSSAITTQTITVTPPPSFISSASCTTASKSLCPSVPPSPAPTASPTPSPSATSFPAAATAADADADADGPVTPETPAAAAATGTDAASLMPLRSASTTTAAATTPPPPPPPSSSRAKLGASGAVATLLSVETLGDEDAFMLAVRAAGKEAHDG